MGFIMTGFWLVSYVVLWGLVLLCLFLILALARRTTDIPSFPQFDKLRVGVSAPPIKAKSLDGVAVNLDTFLDKKVAFVFVSDQCEPCQTIMPALEKVKPKALRSGVELVLVSELEIGEAKRFVERYKVSLPMLLAPQRESTFLQDYKVAGVPFFCLVNERGIVKATDFLNPNLGNLTVHFEDGETSSQYFVGG
jgi:peroxiredoxin